MPNDTHTLPPQLEREGVTYETYRKLLHYGWVDEKGNSLPWNFWIRGGKN